MGHAVDRPDVGYATGWVVHSLPEGRIVEHGGGTFGYASQISFDPDRGTGVVVLTNLIHGDGLAKAIGQYVMDLLQGREPIDYAQQNWDQAAEAEPPPMPGEDAEELPVSAYEGRYANATLGAIEVVADGDELRFTVGPHDAPFTLTRRSGHVFDWRASAPPVEEGSAVLAGAAAFSVDDAGRPDRLVLGDAATWPHPPLVRDP